MCGIIGLVNREEIYNVNTYNECLLNLHHRGPDAQGSWQHENVYLGHTRLAIIDLSDAGKQPMTDSTNRYTITFNGEIYNFKLLREQLPDYQFKSKTDTEVILALYAKYGHETPLLLKGQFAFAIWDNKNKELFIARDRMGEKPLYYTILNGGFYFASEIRALVHLTKKTPEIDNKSLVEFLSQQSVQAPNTLLKDIFQLPAAHHGVFKNFTFKTQKYWDFKVKKKILYNDTKVIQTTIRNLFSDAIGLQMVSDVPLGAFLSGGIDSSAVVAMMAEHSTNPIETFSVGFNVAKYDETPFADIVAKKFKTRHHAIQLNINDFKNKIPEILAKTDSPSADGPNTFIVSEAVKNEGLTVALSGLGGDELFAGYSGFDQFYKLNKFSTLFNSTYLIRNFLKFPFEGKVKNLLKFKNITLQDFYTLSRSVFLPDEIKKLLNNREKIFSTPYTNSYSSFPILAQYSIAELNGYTQNVLLKDTDQMSMANSLEVRVPFFDHDLVEYVLGVPDEYKYPKYPKSLLVESLGDLLPNEIVHRKKMGFTFPWAQWMRGDLKPFCETSLINLCFHDNIFNKEAILKLWKNFLNNDPNISWSKIWLLVSLEQWLKNIKN